MVNYPYAEEEQYLRVYMDARQDNSDGEHVTLFTGLAVAPDADLGATVTSSTVTCYSVLKPCEDVFMQRGWYVPVGVNGAEMIHDLLAPLIPAPVHFDASTAPNIKQSIIAEDNETYLSMAQKILQAINYRLKINGHGDIDIVPVASDDDISATFDPIENDIIETEISIKNDWFDCPNVFQAIDDDLTAIARDDDVNSPLSTVNRGREVWQQESSVDLSDDETLEEYASRRLKELQKASLEASYDRRYWPSVEPTDNVRLHYPAQRLDGVYKVKSQSIELGHGARVSEEVNNL